MKNPFKKEQVTFKTEPPISPYQKARAEWDERIGSSRVEAYSWRMIALLAILIAAFLLVALIVEQKSHQDRLFIVEVSQGGRVVNVAPLVEKYHPTVAQEEYFIARFIDLIRGLSLDPVVAKKSWLNAYNFLSARGAERLNTFFRQNNPVDLLGKKTITTKISSINPVSDKTFEVEWSENTININGQDEGQKNYSGVFTIELKQPSSQEEILQNPLGIYIVDFSITQKN